MRFEFVVEPSDIGALAEHLSRTRPESRRIRFGASAALAIPVAIAALWVAWHQETRFQMLASLLVIGGIGAFAI